MDDDSLACRLMVHQVVRAAMDPAGVAGFHEMCDLRSVQRQHAADVPAGEAKTPGCSALNMASSRCASFTCSTSSWSSSEMSVIPSDAVMIVAVVEAMPLVVKMSLYGAASPVSRSMALFES